MAKTKLPKRVAGVKVPKKLRKTGGKAAALLDHPIIADLIAAGLIAAAAALRDNKSLGRAAKGARAKASGAAKEIGAGAASLGTLVAAKAREGAEWVGETYAGAGAGAGAGSSGAGGRSKAGGAGGRSKAKPAKAAKGGKAKAAGSAKSSSGRKAKKA